LLAGKITTDSSQLDLTGSFAEHGDLTFRRQRLCAPYRARDAVQPDLMDFFDFNNVPWATPTDQRRLKDPAGVNYFSLFEGG
jgi:hypothetical protein